MELAPTGIFVVGLRGLGKPPSPFQAAKSDRFQAEWDRKVGGCAGKCLGVSHQQGEWSTWGWLP